MGGAALGMEMERGDEGMGGGDGGRMGSSRSMSLRH